MIKNLSIIIVVLISILSSMAEQKVELGGFGGMPHLPPIVPEHIPLEYRDSLWGKTKNDYLTKAEAVLRKIQGYEVKLDRLYYHFNNASCLKYNNGELAKEMTTLALKYGIHLSPILNVSICGGDWLKFGIKDTMPYHLQLFPSGIKIRDSFNRLCPNNPITMKVMKDYVKNVTGYLKDTPGFDILSLDDEYGMGYHYASQQINCYCGQCRGRFKQLTGLDAPMLYGPPPGTVINPDSPLHKWLQTIGVNGPINESLARYNTELATAAKSVKPNLKICQWPGLDGKLDRILWELYSEDAVLADATIQKVNAMIYPRKTPLAMYLGWLTKGWIKDRVKKAEQRVRLVGLVCMVNQVKEFGLAPTSCLWEFPGIRRQAKFLGDTFSEYGNLFLSLKRKPAPVAVFYSTQTKMYQSIISRSQDNWRSGKIWRPLWPVLRKSHIPMDIISEAQIRDGWLKKYKALILIDLEYATSDIWEKIKQFASEKKVLFDKKTVLKPANAIPLDESSPEIVNNQLQKIVPKQNYQFDSYDIFYSVMTKDNQDYLIIFNPSKNNVSSRIKVNRPVSKISEFLKNKPLEFKSQDKAAEFTAQINAGDWQVYGIKH